MNAALEERSDRTRIVLPPAFSLVRPQVPADAFAHACSVAERDGAGTLIWTRDENHLDFAVVLEPEEPLGTARRALFVGMSALANAIASVAPPDKPLTLDWPDTVRFDGARLGGGRLGWPEGSREDEAPAWIVFSATLIASKAGAGDPGLTPDTTSLDEEGFEPESHAALVEAFARYLLRAFDVWREEGFDAAARSYLARLAGRDGACRATIDGSGDLVWTEGEPGRKELGPALRMPAWLDPRTGTPRL